MRCSGAGVGEPAYLGQAAEATVTELAPPRAAAYLGKGAAAAATAAAPRGVGAAPWLTHGS